MVIWFILIELLLAVLGAVVFLVVSFKSACRVHWALIGAVIGLCLGPYIYACMIMAQLEQQIIMYEKENAGVY